MHILLIQLLMLHPVEMDNRLQSALNRGNGHVRDKTGVR